MAHRISEETIAWDAALTLQEWFQGYMSLNDGREYKVVLVGYEDVRLTVEVQSTPHLEVQEEQFEIEVRVRKVDV